MNNNFLVTCDEIWQWSSFMISSHMKIMENHLTRNQMILIHGNSCIILYI